MSVKHPKISPSMTDTELLDALNRHAKKSGKFWTVSVPGPESDDGIVLTWAKTSTNVREAIFQLLKKN